jgi:hypothetical protein
MSQNLEPLDSEYSYKEVKEALLRDDLMNILNRYEFLTKVEGIPEPEAKRAIWNEYGYNLDIDPTNMNNADWHNQPQENVLPDLTMKIPDTGYPPVLPFPVLVDTQAWGNDGFDHKQPDPNLIIDDNGPWTKGYAGGRDVENLSQYKTNAPENLVIKSEPYPHEDQSKKNYVDAPFDPPSYPSMHNEYGFNVKKSIPEWRYDVEQDQGGVAELIIERDKKNGQWVKHGTAKRMEQTTDHSLAPIHDVARKVQIPHMEVEPPEFPDEPPMIGEDEFEDDPGDTPLKEVEPDLWQYVYQGHEKDDICNGFNGKKFDLANESNRPVPPSEGLGYTNTHPNCQCYWKPVTEGFRANKATSKQKGHLQHVNRIIGQKSRDGNLHKVHADGKLYKTTTFKNPRLRETIEEIRNEFDWITEDYLERVKGINAPGRMFLIRAGSEAITDHRSEGEPYRRWLSPDELHALARTAIGKQMDLNHLTDEFHPDEFRTDAQILDSEFNKARKEIQMLVNEQDPDILKAIDDGSITAVSINGGSPRRERIECNGECFIIPEGVVLGELDDIALTWVVTNPAGISFHGNWVPPATPGVKTTAIQPL